MSTIPIISTTASSTGPLNGAHPAERQAARIIRDTEGGSLNGNGADPHALDDAEPETTVDQLEAVRDTLALYHQTADSLEGKGVFVLTVVDRPVIDPKTGKEKECKARPQRFAVGDVGGMAAEAVARSATGNVYFAPAVLRPDLPPGARGKFEDIVAVLGSVIDDDGDTGKRALRPAGVEPSIEVTTSTVPVVNRQLHFVYTRPVSPAEGAELAELLYRKCGGDTGTKDSAHCWRLPQTENYPNAVKRGRGRPSEPQPVQLTGGSFEPVDPDALKQRLEAMPDLRPPAHKAQAKGDNNTGGSIDRDAILKSVPSALRDLMAQEKGKRGDRSDHCFRVMQELMEIGLTDDEIRIVAEGEPFAGKFTSRGDIDEEIGRVRAKWEGKGAKRKKVVRSRALTKSLPSRSRIASCSFAGQRVDANQASTSTTRRTPIQAKIRRSQPGVGSAHGSNLWLGRAAETIATGGVCSKSWTVTVFVTSGRCQRGLGRQSVTATTSAASLWIAGLRLPQVARRVIGPTTT